MKGDLIMIFKLKTRMKFVDQENFLVKDREKVKGHSKYEVGNTRFLKYVKRFISSLNNIDSWNSLEVKVVGRKNILESICKFDQSTYGGFTISTLIHRKLVLIGCRRDEHF